MDDNKKKNNIESVLTNENRENMEGVLTEKIREDIQKRIRKVNTEIEYMKRKYPTDARVLDIERDIDFTLNDINIERDVNDATLIQVDNLEKKSTIVLNYSEKEFEIAEIERVADKLKMKLEDVYSLLEHGMQLEQVEKQGIIIVKDAMNNNEPLNSKILSERIIKSDNNNLNVEDEYVTEQEIAGTVVISKLAEITVANEDGKIEFSNDMKKSIEPFEKMNVIDLDKDMYLAREKTESKDGKLGKDKYKVISELDKEKKEDKEEQEKENIANSLDEDAKNIRSIIRVRDKQTCAQLLNDNKIKDSDDSVLIVRFKNNKFKALKQDSNGNTKELVDFKATAPLKSIAPSLENKVGNLYSNFNVGDITAGKTIEGQRYDCFFIDTGSRGDGIGNMVIIRDDGRHNSIDVVKPSSENGYDLEFAEADQIYPKTVIMDTKQIPKEREIVASKNQNNVNYEKNDNKVSKAIEDENKETQDEIAYRIDNGFTGSLAEEKQLLEDLLKIDDEIAEIKASPDIDIGIMSQEMAKNMLAGYAVARDTGAAVGAAKGAREGIQKSKKDKEEKINNLENKRDDIMARLGYAKKDLTRAKEDAELVHSHGPKH